MFVRWCMHGPMARGTAGAAPAGTKVGGMLGCWQSETGLWFSVHRQWHDCGRDASHCLRVTHGCLCHHLKRTPLPGMPVILSAACLPASQQQWQLATRDVFAKGTRFIPCRVYRPRPTTGSGCEAVLTHGCIVLSHRWLHAGV